MAASDDPAVPPAPAVPAPPAPAAEPRSRVGTALGVAITVIAVVLAVSYGVSRGDDDARIVMEVVDLHELAPASAAPATPPPLTGFAANAAADGWLPIGTRTDRLEGRDTTTTFWEKAGSRLAYTTVSGDPVQIPQTGRQTGRAGVLLRSFDEDGRTAVAWTENGHTVVISGIRISRASLYNLAGGPARAAASRSG